MTDNASLSFLLDFLFLFFFFFSLGFPPVCFWWPTDWALNLLSSKSRNSNKSEYLTRSQGVFALLPMYVSGFLFFGGFWGDFVGAQKSVWLCAASIKPTYYTHASVHPLGREMEFVWLTSGHVVCSLRFYPFWILFWTPIPNSCLLYLPSDPLAFSARFRCSIFGFWCAGSSSSKDSPADAVIIVLVWVCLYFPASFSQFLFFFFCFFIHLCYLHVAFSWTPCCRPPARSIFQIFLCCLHLTFCRFLLPFGRASMCDSCHFLYRLLLVLVFCLQLANIDPHWLSFFRL